MVETPPELDPAALLVALLFVPLVPPYPEVFPPTPESMSPTSWILPPLHAPATKELVITPASSCECRILIDPQFLGISASRVADSFRNRTRRVTETRTTDSIQNGRSGVLRRIILGPRLAIPGGWVCAGYQHFQPIAFGRHHASRKPGTMLIQPRLGQAWLTNVYSALCLRE